MQQTQVLYLDQEDPLKWQPTPGFLPREFHRWWSLVGYGPWGCTESEMTECTQHSKNHRDCYGSNTFPVFLTQLTLLNLSMDVASWLDFSQWKIGMLNIIFNLS